MAREEIEADIAMIESQLALLRDGSMGGDRGTPDSPEQQIARYEADLVDRREALLEAQRP